MNRESNRYTIVYASIMVVLVALLLAFTSQYFKEMQKENEAVDKMKQILRSVHIIATNNDAKETFDKLIKTSYVVNIQGKKVDGNAFAIDLSSEFSKPESERLFPVFEAIVEGRTKFILAVRGVGLWGPLWGYISLDDDKKTVYGADFSHASETPGLGAEIATPTFGNEFAGKKIFNSEGKFTSIAIVKPGKTVSDRDYVDGISGGTITSQGVDAMLLSSIGAYSSFLISKE